MSWIKRLFVWGVSLCVFPLYGDNLHFSEVRVVSVSDTGAALEVTVFWSNSWCHSYNHDAVYLFGKYSEDEISGWRHAFFSSDVSSYSVSEGYSVTPTSDGRGLLLRRTSFGSGTSEATLRLTWSLSGNELSVVSASSVLSGAVRFSLQGLEVVYLPPGPFYAGDGVSESSFSTSFFGGIPSESDLIGTDASYVYSANGSESSGVHAGRAADRYNQGVYDASSRHDWCGTVLPATWQVDFGRAKKILYFGVSGVYPDNIPPAPSGTWYFEGSTDGSSWSPLWSGGPEYWGQSRISYPVQQALRVVSPGLYRYYRIRVDGSQQAGYWNTIRISNVAMTEDDLSLRPTDQAVLMDGFHPELPSSYPLGTEGFYAMKYELTQEQYVTFLNQLPRSAQYARTIGGVLDRLEEGDYVFGGLPGSSSHRNGIVVHDRRLNSGLPIVFACDLDRSNPANGSSDGQSVACNYLSPADLLSYAEWTGLRPMSELEYEKMGRSFSPVSEIGAFPAWGSALYVPGTDLSSAGTSLETAVPSDANVNAEGHLPGPLRSGSFTRGGSRFESGISFWGLSDLSGNLSEIYCNTNSWGIQLSRFEHGGGEVTSDGKHQISGLYWPSHPLAYGWRGGDYGSDPVALSLSYRGRSSSGVYDDLSLRFPVAGIRLGLSWSDPVGRSELLLGNGLLTGVSEVCDTVCDGTAYELRGVDVPGSDPAVYIWYGSDDGGISWQNLHVNSAVLRLPDLVSRVSPGRVVSFRYRRVVYTSSGLLESGVAVLVVGRGYTTDRLSDTIRPCMVSEGFHITTPLPATFEWRYIESGKQAAAVSTPFTSACFVQVADLKERPEEFPSGNYRLDLKINTAGRCIDNLSLQVHVTSNTVSPFTKSEEPYVYESNTCILNEKWGGPDRQHWSIVGGGYGNLSIDEATGVLSGITTTFLHDVVVEAVCRDYPDRTYRKTVTETARIISYVAAAQPLVLPAGTYNIACWGADGGMGNGGSNPAGYGGYTEGEIFFPSVQTCYVYTGEYGNGVNTVRGFNGGGQAPAAGGHNGGRGGGATDIRLTGGAWDNVTSLRSRIMVAGGGGGAQPNCGGTQTSAGHAGGLVGATSLNQGGSYVNNRSFGGSQTSGGAFQLGSNATNNGVVGGFGMGAYANTCAAGGGSGYYGGGSQYTSGGGGGSSFISGYAGCNAVNNAGTHTGQPVHFSGMTFTKTVMQGGSENTHGRAPGGYGKALITFVTGL